MATMQSRCLRSTWLSWYGPRWKMRFADNYLNALMINRWGEGGYIRLARDAEAQVQHHNTETETERIVIITLIPVRHWLHPNGRNSLCWRTWQRWAGASFVTIVINVTIIFDVIIIIIINVIKKKLRLISHPPACVRPVRRPLRRLVSSWSSRLRHALKCWNLAKPSEIKNLFLDHAFK